MSLLKPLGMGQGYLKAGFLGFQKSGKTFTAAELAIGTRAYMKHEGPVAMFDTETGSEYIGSRIREATGKDLVGARSRSFDTLMAVANDCLTDGVSILIVDSVTHIWRDLCESYLDQVNRARKRAGRPAKQGLEFQDWGPIKRKWAQWTDFYLNSQLHIIICGRAGYEYDFETNDDGKRELVKTGVKMKTEAEFGFEPSLLIEMEQIRDGKSKVNRATILGDRFNVIDGQTVDNPTFKFFEPHIERLTPGAHAPVDTELKTDMGIDDDGHDYRKQKTIVLEKIEAELVRLWPGQTAKEKASKAEALEAAFGTRSWTEVTSQNLERLKAGLEHVRAAGAAASMEPSA